MTQLRLAGLMLFVALNLGGCATGRYTAEAPQGTSYTTRADEALVIFLRPSNFASGITSALFDSTGNEDRLIAIIGPNEKIAYYCPAGERLFMVVSEAADFVKADLEVGKAYYVNVNPRMGAWRARFSLIPYKRDTGEEDYSTSGDFLRDAVSSTHWVVNTPEADAWSANNSRSIANKRERYFESWLAKPAEDQRQRSLEPQDGLDQMRP